MRYTIKLEIIKIMEDSNNILPTSLKKEESGIDPKSTTYHYPTSFDPILLYTDGSVLKEKKTDSNGIGGFGVLAINATSKVKLFEKSDSAVKTTNNRMELTALLEAFKYLDNNNFHSAIIRSDSEYVVNPLSKGWIHKWHKDSYKDKANSDIWKQIYPLFMKYKGLVVVEWVKGHADDEFNNAADKLATGASNKRKHNK